MADFDIRLAQRDDVADILRLIKKLAEYENLLDEVKADEQTLETWLFDKKTAEVLLAEVGGVAVGYALFFQNFSTFLGKAGLYLEDVFVVKEQRGKGVGQAMFKRLKTIAAERGLGRMEWCCLDWNKSSIEFYTNKQKARPMTGWTIYRLDENQLKY